MDQQNYLKSRADTKRSLDEYTSLKETLEVAKKLNIDLSGFGLMKYFYTNLFVINSSDYEEISRALEGITFYKYDLASKEKAAILVIAGTSDSEKTLKVLRSFNANPFAIPQGFPQVPSEAYALAESKIKELQKNKKQMQKKLLK